MKIQVLQGYSILNSCNLKRQNRKYTVYTDQIKKRFAYLFFSFICVFACAYANRVSLIYSITKSYGFSVVSEGLHKQSLCTMVGLDSPPVRVPPVPPVEVVENLYPPSKDLPLSKDNTFWEKLCLYKHKLSSCMQSDRTVTCVLSSVQNLVFRVFNRKPGRDDACNRDLEISSQVKLIFTDVQEAFSTSLSICLFYSFLFLLSILLYHTLCFLLPGLFISQAQQIFLYVCSCIVAWLFLLWMVDLYLMPKILNFLYGFQITRNSLCLRAETKVYSYVSWCISVYLLFSIIFLVCILLVKWRKTEIFQSLSLFRENSKSFAKTSLLQSRQKDTIYPYLSKGMLVIPSKTCFFTEDAPPGPGPGGGAPPGGPRGGSRGGPRQSRAGIQRGSPRGSPRPGPVSLSNANTKMIVLRLVQKNQSKIKFLRGTQMCIDAKSLPLPLYKPRRAQTICFSLLVSALICPPEGFAQLICTICIIACNEFILAISFVHSYRFLLKV